MLLRRRNSARQVGHQLAWKNRNTGRPSSRSWVEVILAPSGSLRANSGAALPTETPVFGAGAAWGVEAAVGDGCTAVGVGWVVGGVVGAGVGGGVEVGGAVGSGVDVGHSPVTPTSEGDSEPHAGPAARSVKAAKPAIHLAIRVNPTMDLREGDIVKLQ